MRQQCFVAVHLFLRRADEVLLARRFNTGYEDGNYSVPAGHVDDDESAVVAMVREAKEEVNLDLAIDSLRVVHVMHRNTTVGPWVNMFFEYQWNPSLDTLANNEPHKCDELLWSAIHETPSNTVPYVRFALDAVIRGEMYSELDWE